MDIKSFLFLDWIQVDNRKIAVVRDDIFPMIGGGSKARKAVYYEDAMRDGQYNACVTTGGIQSNHNRAIALLCVNNGWRCHLVYHGSRERFQNESGNALIVRNTPASVEFVEASGIGPAMDEAMAKLAVEGYRPMYIHGGGHDLPGGVAFVDAVKTLKTECDKINYKPSCIFHASGTGSTQAGIAVGLDLVGWSDVKLIGISVARPKKRGTQIIESFANSLAEFYGLVKDYTGEINFNTDYIDGGYEMSDNKMSEFLQKSMKETGLMLDNTYSGKAFYGMMDLLRKNDIEKNEDVLFWHTGGIMNLME